MKLRCSTIEYIIPQVVYQPPVFLLVLDIALIEEELDQAKDTGRSPFWRCFDCHFGSQ